MSYLRSPTPGRGQQLSGGLENPSTNQAIIIGTKESNPYVNLTCYARIVCWQCLNARQDL